MFDRYGIALKRGFGLSTILFAIGLIPGACVAQTMNGQDDAVQLAAANEGPPDIGSPLGAYLAGLSAIRDRDLGTASDYMLTALEGDPENPELLRRTFMLIAGEGRHREAVELAERLLAVEPDHLMANLVLAVDRVDADRWDEAEHYLTVLPDRGLGSLLKPLLLAWTAAGTGDEVESMRQLDSLSQDGGIEFLTHLHKGLISEVFADAETAAAEYEAAFQATARPTLRLAWIAGNFYERQGNPERAIEIYRQFLSDGRGTGVVTPLIDRASKGEVPAPLISDAKAGLAEVFFNFASLLVQEDAQDLALVTLQQSLRLRGNFTVAQVLLGEIYQEQNRSHAAIETYRAVPKDSPFAWMVRLRIADELDKINEIELALAELDDLATERPDQFEPYYRMGNLLRSHERFEEAVAAYDKAVERIGEPAPHQWSLLYFRGVALERAKQWDRAEEDFLKALELEPEQPFVMNYLAYSWVEQRRNLDEAKKMLVRAVELRPDDGYIVDSLGWVFFRLGEYESAVEYLERAVELRPQDSVINDHLGDAFWRTGRRSEARFQWRRALSLDPEEEELPKIEKKIDEGLEPEAEDS